MNCHVSLAVQKKKKTNGTKKKVAIQWQTEKTLMFKHSDANNSGICIHFLIHTASAVHSCMAIKCGTIKVNI